MTREQHGQCPAGPAAQRPSGVGLSAWEEAIRAHLQQQMERAVLRLSQAGPAMLGEGGPKFAVVDTILPLPAGDRVRFVASVELVEG